MVSAELLRRYPFFGGLEHDDLVAVARIGREQRVEEGQWLFHEDEEVDHLYLTLEGAVAIVIEVTRGGVEHSVSDQLMRVTDTDAVIVSTVGSGDAFGWSAIVPPHLATSGARAMAPSRLVAFPAAELRPMMDADCAFGYRMVVKVAQLMSQRLRDLRVESLAAYQGS